MRVFVLLLALGACSSSKSKDSAPAARTYDFTAVAGETPGKFEMTVPRSWKVDPVEGDAPTFEFPGALHVGISAMMLPIDKVIRMQFDDAVPRTSLSDGRIWMSETADGNTHARIFVPFEGGVLTGMATLTLPEGDGRLPEIRAAFETIKVVSAPK